MRGTSVKTTVLMAKAYMALDWHADVIARGAQVNADHYSTQNVRRIVAQSVRQCLWSNRWAKALMRNSTLQPMGDVA